MKPNFNKTGSSDFFTGSTIAVISSKARNLYNPLKEKDSSLRYATFGMTSPPKCRKNHKTLLFIIFFSLSVTILASCSDTRKEANQGLIFHYRLRSDPPSLDPTQSTDTISASVVLAIFDGLIQFDPRTLKIIPAIAESWDISSDGITYTFHLRKDVKFHNGREVKAEDFKYSFERTLNPKTRSPRTWVLTPIAGSEEYISGKAKGVSGIRAIDDFTLELKLYRPFAPFLAQLGMEAGSAVPKEEAEKRGDSFTEHPVGCGPYKFVSWKHDVSVVLEAFDGHYEGSPKIKRVEFLIIPDTNVALEKYVADELDMIDEIPPGQLKELRAKYSKDLKVWPTLRIEYVGFNHSKPPFKNNLQLRQAICYAIDREKICNVIREGAATPAKGILPPGILGYDPTIQGYKYNPAKAKVLLAEAGYPNGMGLPEITYWYDSTERNRRTVQFIQSNLKEIGIQTTLKTLDWAAYLQACNAGEPELFRLGWTADYPDADNFLFILLHSSQWGDKGNESRYSNREFDRLVEEARVTSDPEERVKLYSKADRIAVEDACWAPIYYESDEMMIKPFWKGVVLPAQGDFTLPIWKLSK